MIQLSPLPYELNALEPLISRETLEHHYLKHHQNYVTQLNKLIEKTAYEDLSLEEIIFKTTGKSGKEKKIFNNAAQTWNHTFYWSCMTPEKEEAPSAAFKKALSTYFGSYDDFLDEFKKSAKELFGSGWLWLIKDKDGSLKLKPLENAGNPIVDGQIPLLVIDVWEHAYYLDQQENREKYCENFVKTIHWTFVESNFRKENPDFVLSHPHKTDSKTKGSQPFSRH